MAGAAGHRSECDIAGFVAHADERSVHAQTLDDVPLNEPANLIQRGLERNRARTAFPRLLAGNVVAIGAAPRCRSGFCEPWDRRMNAAP